MSHIARVYMAPQVLQLLAPRPPSGKRQQLHQKLAHEVRRDAQVHGVQPVNAAYQRRVEVGQAHERARAQSVALQTAETSPMAQPLGPPLRCARRVLVGRGRCRAKPTDAP